MKVAMLAMFICIKLLSFGQFIEEDFEPYAEESAKNRMLMKIIPVLNDNEFNRYLGKYRTGDSIWISKKYGGLRAQVKIDLNLKSQKPFGIFFSGKTKFEASAMHLIDSIISDRRSQGYISERRAFSIEDEIKLSDLKKGIIYFKHPFATAIIIEPSIITDKNGKPLPSTYYFYIYDFNYMRAFVEQ